MAGKKTAEAHEQKTCVIQNGKYPQYLTGIVTNDKSGKVFTYGTLDRSKAMRFTEEEGRKIVEECHGRLLILA